ncbi:QueT transporter family protein [Dactylosporangium roseum]|uniref:QueT transporter family protein n=1 Tax=Dactylosporangium roseum TaxID=47989 RepID=A0ABY5ZER9_9ACTN|nr:QueT transporter family protein [Dactylosporangium roseum]UWZ39138.1 QueT transporter family protein [Dactylosporangium roseum]
MGTDQVRQIVEALGTGTMNVIGAVVFVLATIVFVMELAGYRPYLRRPFVRRHTTRWDAMALVKVAITAALFGAGLAIFAGVVFVPGVAYLRPAQAFTTVFGILFGLPGALGAGLGNFIGDIFAGTLTLGSIAGFIGNFMSAYVPYRIVHAARQADLSAARDFVRYVWAVIAGAFVIAFYIPWWLAVLGIIPSEVAWTAVFGNIWLNGLVTPLILGTILLRVLFPYVQRWNMYWADSERADPALRSDGRARRGAGDTRPVATGEEA